MALVFALSGSAYAASSLPASSVGTKQLKNGAVTTKKLSQHSVGPSIVKNNSLTAQQVKSASDANALGGTSASVFQRLLGASCNSAIAKINSDGSVGCSSGAGRAGVFGGSNGSLNPAAVNILAPTGLSTPVGVGSESSVTTGAPGVGGTASNLSASVQAAPGINNGWIVTMRVGNPLAATPLSCKIENSATSCTDNTDTASIPVGGPVDIQFSPENSPTATRALFGWTTGS